MPSRPPWVRACGRAGATAYNRGQVLVPRGRGCSRRAASQFVDEIVAQTGVSTAVAGAEVDEAIDPLGLVRRVVRQVHAGKSGSF